MAKFGGAALKLLQTVLYAIEFCCAGIVLGIYSYFMSVLADRDLPIFEWAKAVEGISGAAVLYTIFAVLLTCCLGGKSFFAFLGIILDVLFTGAFIALAVLTRDGASNCRGDFVKTPLGNGPEDSRDGYTSGNGDNKNKVTYAVSLHTACRFNTACFAVSILGAFLFLISALVQLALGRHHKKEKRYGPSPANNYTRGSGGRFWQRRRKNQGLRDPEMAGTVPATTGTGALAPAATDTRPSHDTAHTGSTVANNAAYENPNKPLAGGYHTAPTGTYGHNTATNY